MQEPQPAWRTNYHLILFHPEQPLALVCESAEGTMLPLVSVAARAYYNRVDIAQQGFRDTFGLDVSVMRLLAVNPDREATHQTDFVYSAELQTAPSALSSGWRWLARSDLPQARLTPEHYAPILATALAEAETGVVPTQRAPWARRGWYATAVAWARDQLAQLGMTLTGPIQQIRAWSISCILCAPTTQGDVYFKALPPHFASEPAITAGLAVLFPDYVPPPLALDPARGWMLLADFGKTLSGEYDLPTWEAALAHHARVQRATVASFDQLDALGCEDRRLPMLERDIVSLLNDEVALTSLAAEQRDRLRAALPWLLAQATALAAYAIPATLVHGDLHPGNLAQRDGRIICFDWTDACVAHPFIDIQPFREVISELNGKQQVWERLRAAYLAEWGDVLPPDQLQAAFDRAEIVGALHHAISYARIVASLEPAVKHEFEDGVRYWLGEVVKMLPDAPESGLVAQVL